MIKTALHGIDSSNKNYSKLRRKLNFIATIWTMFVVMKKQNYATFCKNSLVRLDGNQIIKIMQTNSEINTLFRYIYISIRKSHRCLK